MPLNIQAIPTNPKVLSAYATPKTNTSIPLFNLIFTASKA
jgi:hypothetical protein